MAAAQLNLFGYNTIARQLMGPVILGAIMFWAAGTTDWFWGWVFNVVHLLAWGMMTLVLVRFNPELLNARGQRRTDAKPWDNIILMIYSLDWALMLVVGGLDYRYGWTGAVASHWYIIGNVLILLGFALTTWAMAVNRNFEAQVRIQQDRGHQVITGGPYRFVRHPGYTGVIVSFYFGMPLALGSWVAFAVGLVGLVTMVVRTSLEDRTLQAELPGYAEFTQRTRYRLIPGVW